MEMLKLKNGQEEPKPLVQTILVSMRSLLENDPISFFELVSVARDPAHAIWGTCDKKLQGLALLDMNGGMHSSVRNVVLSSVEGEGLDMVLVSPAR